MTASHDPATASGARSLAVRLLVDDDQYRTLERTAAGIGVKVEQLAAVWLAERLASETASHVAVRGAADLRDIRGSLRQLIDDIDALAAGTAIEGADPASRSRPAASTRESLHSEIVAVLRDRGEPLSAAEIAEAIRSRGRYHPPRSGSITGAAVSRRIANPYYKTLFERSGRRVTLARTRRDGP